MNKNSKNSMKNIPIKKKTKNLSPSLKKLRRKNPQLKK